MKKVVVPNLIRFKLKIIKIVHSKNLIPNQSHLMIALPMILYFIPNLVWLEKGQSNFICF